MSNITVEVIDAGRAGVELVTFDPRPKGCPGLGGWKNHASGGLFTRVKGPEAKRLFQVSIRAPGRIVTLEMEGDRIVNITI